MTEAVRKKYQLAESSWHAFGGNDGLVEKIEAEKIRRIRDGSSKRERAQLLVVKAPNVVGNIMDDASASPPHSGRDQDADGFAANGPGASAPAETVYNSDKLGQRR